jgi:hypothetical protein
VTIESHEFCRSLNGDRWLLIRDSETGQSLVRHEPALASGGRVTETPIEVFLDRTGLSPENLALRRLLEQLA